MRIAGDFVVVFHTRLLMFLFLVSFVCFISVCSIFFFASVFVCFKWKAVVLIAVIAALLLASP